MSDLQRRIVLYAAAAVLAGLLVVIWLWPEPNSREREALRIREQVYGDGEGDPRLVLFVVLDTVRADHTSLCGYARPTTPFLEELKGLGASVTCLAQVSGSWTVPVHASFFTGEDVPSHGAHYAASAQGVDYDGLAMHPLDERFPTLAEQLAARGYQTVAVSANSLVSSATGLMRGFEHRSSPGELHAFYRAPGVLTEVARILDAEIQREKPLFLFVNLMDAHDPWPAIPEGAGWVPPRESLRWECGPEEECTLDRFFRGTLAEENRRAWLEHVTDLYDHGVATADGGLRDLVGLLRERGWLDEGYRLVVTSDHGELLGEHGLAYHGRYLYEPITRVPLLVHEGGGTPPALPGPFPGTGVFHLVRDGGPGAEVVQATAAAYPERGWVRKYDGKVGGSTSAAIWQGSQKLLWMDGTVQVFDLSQDPGEERPVTVDEHALSGEMDTLVTRVLESGGTAATMTPEMIEALRAVGYVQ